MSKARRITWLLIVACLLSMMANAEAAISSKDSATIVDYTGKTVEIPCPLERVISISSYASEIICALDEGDKIIGRDSYSIFPPYLEDIPVVGRSSHKPSIELILEMNPDVVIADTMLSDDSREKIEGAGIPVIVQRSGNPERTIANVRNMGIVLDKEERAEEIVDFIEHYNSIIEERTADIEQKDKPVVYGEWRSEWNVATPGTSFGDKIMAAGGVSIADDKTPGEYVVVSAEWVAERDPDVIVLQAPSKTPTKEELEEMKNELVTRPGLSDTKAVKDDRVYITTSGILGGVPSVIGYLHLAKWFYPDIFEDIDPEAAHRELLQELFSVELEQLERVYVYP